MTLNLSIYEASQYDSLKTVDDTLKVWNDKNSTASGLRIKRIPHKGVGHGHSVTDGDFKSQTLYVLDTTENPDKGMTS